MNDHDLVITIGDCTFHAACSCGRALRPDSIRPDQSLDLFQPAWENHIMTETRPDYLE